jgi:isopentenyl phosphate kinase
MEKITIEQAKQQITEGFSSVLTREDVLHLLDCLEVKSESKFKLTKEQISNLAEHISEEINDAGTDVVSDYELSMSYKEVELDSIDFDVQSTVEHAIKEFINELNEA